MGYVVGKTEGSRNTGAWTVEQGTGEASSIMVGNRVKTANMVGPFATSTKEVE